MISFAVAGVPAPKGSMRAMLVKGRPMMIPGGSPENQKAQRRWDKAVKAAAAELLGGREGPLLMGAIEVVLVFQLERPGSHYGARGLLPSAPHHHTVPPDADKLTRAVLDSLKGLVFEDDARIAIVTAHKQWCQAQGGVSITARTLPTPQLPLDLSST